MQTTIPVHTFDHTSSEKTVDDVARELLPEWTRNIVDAYRWACPSESVAYWVARLQ